MRYMSSSRISNELQFKVSRSGLSGDPLSGLTFGLVNTPQAMAHALLALLNPVFSLYTLMVAIPIGAFFTSAAFINVATTSVLAVATGDVLVFYPQESRKIMLRPFPRL